MYALKSLLNWSSPRFLASALIGTCLAAGVAQAEVIHFEWIAGDGEWTTRSNWSPSPTATIGANRDSALDRVTIDGNVTVRRNGNVLFYDLGTDGLKGGTFDALSLKNGATLEVSGNFRVSTASGGINAATRNVFIDSGSSLIVGGDITTGSQNSATAKSTWTVHGSVSGTRFLGQQSTNATGNLGINGGFVLNIDGGSFTIADTFNFKNSGGNLPNLTGQINLSSNGIFTVGEILNWTGSTENYVNFVDGSGTFTFAHADWNTKADVEELIERGFIRKESSVTGVFDIIDTGSAWQVSVIPEPNGIALIALGAGAAIFLCGKSRAKGAQ